MEIIELSKYEIYRTDKKIRKTSKMLILLKYSLK